MQAGTSPRCAKSKHAYPAGIPKPAMPWMGESSFRTAVRVTHFHDFHMETPHRALPQCLWAGSARHLRSAASEKRPLPSRARLRSLPMVGTSRFGAIGLQTRSFMYIDDCVEGLLRLMASRYREPLNLGTEELISVDGLVDLTCEIAGKKLVKCHDLSKPQEVRGRNSDNSRLREVLGWEPRIRLRDGLTVTYKWIERELRKAGRFAPVLAYAAD